MMKDAKKYVSLKCDANNKIIHSKDHGSVVIKIAKVDSNGVRTGECVKYMISGAVRADGKADEALCKLAVRDGLMKDVFGHSNL